MDCLVHNIADNVGVVLHDVIDCEVLAVSCLEDSNTFSLAAHGEVPANFKISLSDIRAGEHVVEYGESIGRATSFISKGEQVHIHNVKSLRL